MSVSIIPRQNLAILRVGIISSNTQVYVINISLTFCSSPWRRREWDKDMKRKTQVQVNCLQMFIEREVSLTLLSRGETRMLLVYESTESRWKQEKGVCFHLHLLVVSTFSWGWKGWRRKCQCYLPAIPYLFKNKYNKFARNKGHYGFRIISKPY